MKSEFYSLIVALGVSTKLLAGDTISLLNVSYDPTRELYIEDPAGTTSP